MRNTILAAVAAAAVLVSAPRGARACGQGGGQYSGLATLAVIATAVGAVDTGLLLYDAGSTLGSHRASNGYATFELIFAGPQLALGLWTTGALLGTAYRNGDSIAAAGLYTLGMGLLLTHAIWTLSTAPASVPSDLERAALPRVQPQTRAVLSVGPTYVPVGQQSHPGLGLTGRF